VHFNKIIFLLLNQ